MPLFTGWVSIYKETGKTIPEECSNFYVVINSALISEPYELVDGDIIKGEILDLLEAGSQRTEFRNNTLTLILRARAWQRILERPTNKACCLFVRFGRSKPHELKRVTFGNAFVYR
jgi:hypothetical protein